MKLSEFIERIKLAESSRTLYIRGCIGSPMNAANKKRYSNNNAYNKGRASMINAASADTFGFDCVCLIKAALGSWSADVNKTYGGTIVNKEANGISYGYDHVPDVGADGIVKYLLGVTTEFSNIVVGEVVWMQGHVGVYVGDGKVIECTPKWTNNVQYSNLGNTGNKTGHYRIWTKHGKLPWVDYSGLQNPAPVASADDAEYYTVKKGDTLSKIGTNVLMKLNPEIKDASKIYVGQRIRVR